MKILVLGASGQIGSHLCDFLRRKGHHPIEFDLVRSEKEDLRVENSQLLNEAIDGCDFVYFLAFDVGGSRYLKKYQHTFEFTQNNVRLMANTFECLKKHNKPFIFASSQMSNMDHSPYGFQKRLGEHYTKLLNGLVVKFWNVYGIEKDLDKSHVITDFILKAKDNSIIDMITDGTEERQFLYAEDASEAMYILMDSYKTVDRNKELHIANHKWNTILSVASEIVKHFPAKIVPVENKDEVQMGMKNEPNPYILEFWQPKTSIEDGIEIICNHYKSIE